MSSVRAARTSVRRAQRLPSRSSRRAWSPTKELIRILGTRQDFITRRAAEGHFLTPAALLFDADGAFIQSLREKLGGGSVSDLPYLAGARSDGPQLIAVRHDHMIAYGARGEKLWPR
jgi:hypothetical protein